MNDQTITPAQAFPAPGETWVQRQLGYHVFIVRMTPTTVEYSRIDGGGEAVRFTIATHEFLKTYRPNLPEGLRDDETHDLSESIALDIDELDRQRVQLAGQAMQGMLAGLTAEQITYREEDVAIDAVRMADRMLAELSK